MKSILITFCVLSFIAKADPYSLNISFDPDPESSKDENLYDRSNSGSGAAVPETFKMESVAGEVLNNLKKAKGILPAEPPHLVVRKFRGSQKIAAMYLEKGEIHLDQLTYKICRQLGQDSIHAIAFILGHELGHYIHRHGGINHNIAEVLSDDPVTTDTIITQSTGDTIRIDDEFNERILEIIKNYNATRDEAEADFEGGFLGYLAGYKPMAAGKKLLKKLYTHPLMSLRETIKGYPTLTDRVEIVDKTTYDLSSLTPLFEMSGYLMAIEQYEDAIPYLEKILEKFQSREIYNNIGVIYLLETLRLFPRPITEYKFPLTLDVEFRAPHPQYYDSYTIRDRGFLSDIFKDNKHCLPTYAQKQIETAEAYFQKAIQLDGDYFTAFLNLSIAQSLKAILYKGWACRINRESALNSALGTALIALDLVEESMSDYSAEYFEFPSADTIENISIYDIYDVEQLDPFKKVIDSLGDTIITNIRQYYPFRKEFFNNTDWSTRTDWELLNSKYVRWNTPANQTPDQAVHLSNINVQIDLVRIFKNEMNDGYFKLPHRFRFDARMVRPFARALEVYPENELARYNQNIALGVTSSSENEGVDSVCLKNLLIKGRSLTEIADTTSDWNFKEILSKSKLITHFISDLEITDQDRLNLRQDYASLDQSIQFSSSEDHTLFVNTSKLSKDKRIEKSVIYVPVDFSDLSTNCDIRVGSKQQDLEVKYGPASHSVTLSNGTYIIYKTRFDQKVTMDTVPASISVSDENRYYASSVAKDEQGIIYKIDNSRKVTGWAFYHKATSTGFSLEVE